MSEGHNFPTEGPIKEGIPYALHKNRVRVFISKADIGKYDEYEKGDPYSVENKIDTAFHCRRENATIELIRGVFLKNECEGKRILDIGCGEGHITAAIKKAFPFCEMSALDCSISAIEKAVVKFPGIDFVVADAHCAPYKDGYFDVVVCNNLWEHVSDPLRLLEHVRKVTRPGGFLIISTPSRYRLNNILRIVLGKPIVFMSPNHVTEYSVGQVVEQLRYGGYVVKRIFTRSIGSESGNLIKRIFSEFLAGCVRLIGKIINRPHDVESTVFFLAKKEENEK